MVLVFLLYDVQGSLAAQIEVLQHGDGVMFYMVSTHDENLVLLRLYYCANVTFSVGKQLAGLVNEDHKFAMSSEYPENVWRQETEQRRFT